MPPLTLGADVSKGYADFCFQDPDGNRLPGSQRYDDTPSGHAAVRQRCQELLDQWPEALLLIGVEASGRLERNWLQTWRTALPQARVRVYQLNPLAVRVFLERHLHRNYTDAQSAQGIADYLREGLRPADRPFEPRLEGPLLLYRLVHDTQHRQTQVQNQLQSLLPTVHPDLVRFCRQGFPQWVLHLLDRYPTAAELQRVRPTTLAKIPYVTVARAKTLVQAAQQSIAGLQGAHVGQVVRTLVHEWLRLETQSTTLKQQLISEFATDPEVRRLRTLIGVGAWTAVVIRLELGTLTRFHSAAAVVAYAGLNPRRQESGDQKKETHISRRGRSGLRKALYLPAQCAACHNPAIRAFYERLRAAGKAHDAAIAACMAKLLRIAYACIMTEKDFDPAYQTSSAAPAEAAPPPAHTTAAEETAAASPATLVVTAPVSYREARKRVAQQRTERARANQQEGAVAPQAGGPRRVRGRNTAPEPHDNQSGTARPTPSKTRLKTP